MDNRVSENKQNIRQKHKLHYEYHGKLESGINSGKSNPSRNKILKRHLSGRLILPITIRYSNDASKLHT